MDLAMQQGMFKHMVRLGCIAACAAACSGEDEADGAAGGGGAATGGQSSAGAAGAGGGQGGGSAGASGAGPDAGADAAQDSGALDAGADASLGELKAFPTAVGFGKNATGGRGGKVVQVTNLNDSGAGSLRAALSMTGPRTIVFRVGGTIQGKSYLSITPANGDVTIAGQTAPGGGIAIQGSELRITGSNVILRHLRIRPGDDTTASNEDGLRIVSYGGNLVSDVIADHCSITWAKDENLSIGGIGSGSRARNITIQNSIVGENINTGYGVLLWNDSKNISFYKNLLVHNKERNIRSSTCTSNFEMINNVVFHYRAGTSPTYENHFDVVGNVYKTHPSLVPPNQTVRLEASLNNCPNGKIALTRAYIADNSLDGSAITVSSNLTPYLEKSAIFNSGITPLPLANVEAAVLADVGATKPSRDGVDLRLIDETKKRTGKLISSVNDVGGYPTLATAAPYKDADQDGMSDDWEQQHGLNPSDASDGAKDSGNGYTNLEVFLHDLTTGA